MNTELLSLFNQGLHISDVYREVFKKLGLEFRGVYTIRQLIEKGKERGLHIVRIKGIEFDNNVDPLVYDMSKSDFEKRFFGGVMFDDEQKRKSYEQITDILDEEFVLDEMEIKKNVISTNGDDCLLHIRGLETGTDTQINIPRQELLTILVPY